VKPLIRRRYGTWCCCIVDERTGLPILPWGHGYSIGQAFDEWKAMQ
jgi:hypothetical protein